LAPQAKMLGSSNKTSDSFFSIAASNLFSFISKTENPNAYSGHVGLPLYKNKVATCQWMAESILLRVQLDLLLLSEEIVQKLPGHSIIFPFHYFL
jgi:hypothetical protein